MKLLQEKINYKKKKITLAQQRLLTYTPEKMKNYFKLKDFLTISMAAEKHGGSSKL